MSNKIYYQEDCNLSLLEGKTDLKLSSDKYSIEVNLPMIVDLLKKKEYARFVEEFSIWLERETMIDNHGTIMKSMKDIGKTLYQNLYEFEKISCTDTCKLIWEQ